MRLTIFSVPKPFQGRFAVIQENAIRSWVALEPRPDIVLYGDEPGVAAACAKFGVTHEPAIGLNEFGTPLLDEVFRRAQERGGMLCFVNADIILMSDFLSAVGAVSDRPRFLLVGRRSNLRIDRPVAFDQGWEAELRKRAIAANDVDDYYWIDYFVFPAGLFDEIPSFAIGRPGYDNWLIWKARNRGADVVDASAAVVAIHQPHDYSHFQERDGTAPDLAGRRHALAAGTEARRNRALLERWDRYLTIAHASHRMDAAFEVKRSYSMRHLAARAGLWWRRAVDVSRPLRKRVGLHRPTQS